MKILSNCRCILPVAAAAMLALAGGCAVVSCTKPGSFDGITIKDSGGKPSEMILISTDGLYLFWTIPIASGDLRWNDETKSIEGGTVFFKDLVAIDDLQTALLKYAESRNCDLAEVYYNDSDVSFADPSYEGLIGICFGSSTMSVSAVLIPRETPPAIQ